LGSGEEFTESHLKGGKEFGSNMAVLTVNPNRDISDKVFVSKIDK
jgi:hypothetical protein